MNTEALSLITAAAAGITNGVVSAFTLAFPSRPRWMAFLAALLSGIVLAFLAAAAYLPANAPLDRQIIAQVIITGLGAGLAAAGLSITQSSATAAREQAQPRVPEPDPTHPAAEVKHG